MRLLSPSVSAGLILTLLFCFQAIQAGQLEPSEPPISGTMKTLDQIEPRIPIQSLSGTNTIVYLITEPGTYYLTDHIVSNINNKTVIHVQAGHVTIDLNGYTISRSWATTDPDQISGYSGISIDHSYTDVTIKNGAIVSDFRTDGETYYRGFTFGIAILKVSGSTPKITSHATIRDVTIEKAARAGLQLWGDGHRVENCVISDCPWDGVRTENRAIITGCRINNCATHSNSYAGIQCLNSCQIIGNTCTHNGYYGMRIGQDCLIQNNICGYNGYYGLYCSSNCTVKGNNICDNTQGGGLLCSHSCLIIDNVCCRNTGVGISANTQVVMLKNNVALGNTVASMVSGSGSVRVDNLTD